ncbi:MAG TPA: SMP-30/gluconolactonase/LRE family protein [Bryobacteraceae bacterium]|nr:SMP-30/gluconolactonase/LRE family protein [Bryobacteraceae bacterium]
MLRREFAGFCVFGAALGKWQDQGEVFVERVAGGFRFTEGPVWLGGGVLAFSDIPTSRVLRWSAKDGVQLLRGDSGGANGLAVDGRGRLYMCEGTGRRVTRMDSGGKIEVLAERFEGKRLNSPNDIALRKDGHVWFSDPAFGARADTRELPFHGVFHLKPDKELEVVARMDRRPNGVALSPDGRMLYVAVSDERSVRAWDLDRGGEASNPRLVITGIDGPPDGLKVDEQGTIHVASNALATYDTHGKLLKTLPLSEKPSNLCFASDNRTLYVTARTAVYRVLLDGKPAQAQP